MTKFGLAACGDARLRLPPRARLQDGRAVHRTGAVPRSRPSCSPMWRPTSNDAARPRCQLRRLRHEDCGAAQRRRECFSSTSTPKRFTSFHANAREISVLSISCGNSWTLTVDERSTCIVHRGPSKRSGRASLPNFRLPSAERNDRGDRASVTVSSAYVRPALAPKRGCAPAMRSRPCPRRRR